MRQDPVDHRTRRDERDDPHRRAARRTPERVHLEDPPQQLGPPELSLRATQRLPLDDPTIVRRVGPELPGSSWPRATAIFTCMPRSSPKQY